MESNLILMDIKRVIIIISNVIASIRKKKLAYR